MRRPILIVHELNTANIIGDDDDDDDDDQSINQ